MASRKCKPLKLSLVLCLPTCKIGSSPLVRFVCTISIVYFDVVGKFRHIELSA